MTTSSARQPKGIPVGGQFAATTQSESSVVLPATGKAAPFAVLESAVGTDRDPASVPWPEDLPNKGYVEVWVGEDDVRSILEGTGQEDALEGLDRVYAGISLQADKEADFWGVKADGSEDIVALGVHSYEQAVDPDDHADLNYRDGYTDPMPAYNAARDAVQAKRLEKAAALLGDAGVTVELEDQRRQEFRLRSAGGRNLRLRLANYRPQLIETTNWKPAEPEHIDDFLSGPASDDSEGLLLTAATLVARDLHTQSYRKSA